MGSDFLRKSPDRQATIDVLNLAEPFFDVQPTSLVNAVPSSEDDIVEYIAHQRDSGVGPDGLPYSAWKATGHHGRTTLHRVSSTLQAADHIDQYLSRFLFTFNMS